jgi:hypothetical protein
MRHRFFAILVLLLFSTSAKAETDLVCESWKGGTEVHCQAKKISGDAPERPGFIAWQRDRPISYSASVWWSVCGLAGVILRDVTWVDQKYNQFYYGQLSLPNQCLEVYFFNCSRNGKYEPCTDLLAPTGQH